MASTERSRDHLNSRAHYNDFELCAIVYFLFVSVLNVINIFIIPCSISIWCHLVYRESSAWKYYSQTQIIKGVSRKHQHPHMADVYFVVPLTAKRECPCLLHAVPERVAGILDLTLGRSSLVQESHGDRTLVLLSQTKEQFSLISTHPSRLQPGGFPRHGRASMSLDTLDGQQGFRSLRQSLPRYSSRPIPYFRNEYISLAAHEMTIASEKHMQWEGHHCWHPLVWYIQSQRQLPILDTHCDMCCSSSWLEMKDLLSIKYRSHCSCDKCSPECCN